MVKSEPVTPLGRPKATKSLGGMVEPEPLPRLLIWHICHESFGDLADLNHCHSYWGPWSCPTMVIPSEQLSIAYFCKWFLSLPLLPCCFHGLFVLCFCWISFMSTSIFFLVQPMIFDSPLIRRPSARFDFMLPSYYGVNRCSLPGLTFNYKLSIQDQVIIRRLSARSGLTTSRQYYMWLNRCLLQPGMVLS